MYISSVIRVAAKEEDFSGFIMQYFVTTSLQPFATNAFVQFGIIAPKKTMKLNENDVNIKNIS